MIRPHILVVDDDRDTLLLIGMVLEQQGYRVSQAEDAQAAWPLIEADPPDLIVLDVMMPGEDGFSMTRRLRENPTTADLPILLFTAKGLLNDKATGFQAGADDYLTKPVHPADLLARVHAILARRGLGAPPKHPQIAACVGIGPEGNAASAAVGLTRALAALDRAAVVIGPVAEPDDMLSDLLADPASLTPEHIEASLLPLGGGGGALPGPAFALYESQLDAAGLDDLLDALAPLADTAVFYLGPVSDELNCTLLRLANHLLLVAEPTRESLTAAHHITTHLCDLGATRPRTSLALVYHTDDAAQLNTDAIREGLGIASVLLVPAWQKADAEPYHSLAQRLRKRAGAASSGI